MANIENSTVVDPTTIESKHAVADKEELVAAFSKLSDAEKAQFYKDCEEGISPEDVRQAMHQKIRQLWGK